MQDNTVAVEEEKPSSSAKKLLNHWLRFSSVVVVSNAQTLRERISSSLGPDAVAKHMVAVSTNLTFAVLLECCLYLFNMDFQLLRSTLFMVVSIIFESFLKFVAEPHQ
ncbi:hypothetical protein ACE6H2_005654 [Prunus campanulata]